MKVKGILWHSTGANNPKISRYVQPSADDPNYEYLMSLLGDNPNNNDWNHTVVYAGLNAWIGKLADGSVATVQSMPWDFAPWGCGEGPKGSCNDGWIQFEICEDGLNDPNYFAEVYQEACELTAYLCLMYNIDPNGTVEHNGVTVPTILCHHDSYKLGLGSGHSDVTHWFPRYGKSMTSVRQDVATLMKGNSILIPIIENEDDEDMTQEQFNRMMDNYLIQLAKQPPSDWSKDCRTYCEAKGLIKGDEKGNKMYKKFVTREELASVLHRIFEYGLPK